MLFMVDGNGVKQITKHFVTKQELKALQDILPSVLDYIMAEVDKPNDFFSCGTNLGGNWAKDHPPLMALFDFYGDGEAAGKLLGCLVLDHMVDRSDSWCCTKSNFSGRDFSTMAYWPRPLDRQKR